MAGTSTLHILFILVSTALKTVLSESCKNCFIGGGLGWMNSPCSDCCCKQNIPKSENCCYKIAHDNPPSNEQPISGTYIYFVAALVSLLLVTITLFCFFRMSETKCCRWLCRGGRRSTSERSTNCNLSGVDNPPAYESVELQELKIVIPESPPYVKDPPTYAESLANPIDTGENTPG